MCIRDSYGSLGCLVRYLQKENLVNSVSIPTKSYENDPVQHIQRYLLVNFPSQWIILAMVCSFSIYALLDYAYYKKGHPKKNVIHEHMIGKDLERLSKEMAHQEEV